MLTISNLVAGYGKVQVLHGISMEVPKGKVVTLIGSNGAGKTTTMRAISGMIKPTAGEINLHGKRIDGLESYTIAKQGLAHSPEGRRVFATMTVTARMVVVLPAPLEPISVTTLPLGTSMEMPCRTCTLP